MSLTHACMASFQVHSGWPYIGHHSTLVHISLAEVEEHILYYSVE